MTPVVAAVVLETTEISISMGSFFWDYSRVKAVVPAAQVSVSESGLQQPLFIAPRYFRRNAM